MCAAGLSGTASAAASAPRRRLSPARVVAKLRTEKKERGGKTVTVVYDLPRNAEFLQALSQDLKRACGTGGTVVEGGVEIQGDLRERVRDALTKRGFVVKG
jgi:translation initiation factor 1